jgi:hypothetical protein
MPEVSASAFSQSCILPQKSSVCICSPSPTPFITEQVISFHIITLLKHKSEINGLDIIFGSPFIKAFLEEDQG